MAAVVTQTCPNFMLYVHCLSCFDGPVVVTCLKHLGADLSGQRPRVHPKPLHVRFMVEEVAQGQVLLQFSPVTTIPPMLSALLSLVLYTCSSWHNCYTTHTWWSCVCFSFYEYELL